MTTPATIATTSANTTTAPTIAKIKVSFESSSDDDFCPGAIVIVFVDDRCNDDDVAERVVFVAVVDDDDLSSTIVDIVVLVVAPRDTDVGDSNVGVGNGM